MKRQLFKNSILLLLGGALTLSACIKRENDEPDANPESRVYSVAMASGSGSSSTTYTQGTEDLSSGNITFSGFGFEVPSTRTARIFASKDGKSLFNLDYGGGKVYKYEVKGGQNYVLTAETNVQYAIGTTHPRWTKVSEDYALLHNVTTERKYNEAGEYVKTVAKARLMSISLDNLDIRKIEEFEIPAGADSEAGNYVFRIDAPIVVGNKAYYGLGKRVYNASRDVAEVPEYVNVETMVVDYPSLTNPKIISTNAGGAKGATNGYRTPVCHQDESGNIYQIITVGDNSDDTFILKIINGAYDDNYSFNLSQALGERTITNGWFYVGNGIGYVPYTTAGTADPAWAVARVDLNSRTAVKLNLPPNLWLQQYQDGVMVDGKFCMAITPLGAEGNIYMFEPTSTSADGFTKGASLKTGADAYYIGIY